MLAAPASADPCGMVPPIWEGQGAPIKRVGLQKTYVFFKDGVETFVIRPGFTGKVDNFGMLIPFPSTPEIRKVPDQTFAHIDAAVDPPPVVINLNPIRRKYRSMARPMAAKKAEAAPEKSLAYDEVRVVKKEAVGMYEIAVLEAGSPKALERWMSEHGYRYPDGMDDAVHAYVDEKWNFVAVKTRVGAKDKVDPRPGMRKANPARPAGSNFDGHVQAMGFRFKVKRPVVPMRLSSFNEGELRNLVYYLGERPVRMNNLPTGLVQRQVPGLRLYRNVSDLLPIRIIGGGMRKVTKERLESIKYNRDPTQHNGIARELFASDLLAVKTGELSLKFEEREKQLLNISERLNLRGVAIDGLHAAELKKERDKTLKGAGRGLRAMTMTVFDGDLPREYIAKYNLTFSTFRMPAARNDRTRYHAPTHGPLPSWQSQGVFVNRGIAKWATQQNEGLDYWNEVWDRE